MPDVNEVVPASPEPVVEPVVTPEVVVAAPGSKTDSVQLLESLKDEREKRRLLQEELDLLKATSTSADVFSDEGKALQKQIDEAKAEIETLSRSNALKDVQMAHPILKEKWTEFETFREDPDNKGMNLRTAAKAFLVENGLLDPVRRGLEKTTGGDRVPPSTKMSNEDIKHLRETNFKKYTEMLEKGLLD